MQTFIYPKISINNMVYVQLDLPEDINEQLKIIKIKRKDTTLQETALFILSKYIPMEGKNYGC